MKAGTSRRGLTGYGIVWALVAPASVLNVGYAISDDAVVRAYDLLGVIALGNSVANIGRLGTRSTQLMLIGTLLLLLAPFALNPIILIRIAIFPIIAGAFVMLPKATRLLVANAVVWASVAMGYAASAYTMWAGAVGANRAYSSYGPFLERFERIIPIGSDTAKLITSDGLPRVGLFVGHPNALGGVLVLSLVIHLLTRPRDSGVRLVKDGIVGFGLVFGILATGSRTGILATLGVLFVYVAGQPRHHLKALVISSFATLGVAVLAPRWFERSTNLSDQQNLAVRVTTWEQSFYLYQQGLEIDQPLIVHNSLLLPIANSGVPAGALITFGFMSVLVLAMLSCVGFRLLIIAASLPLLLMEDHIQVPCFLALWSILIGLMCVEHDKDAADRAVAPVVSVTDFGIRQDRPKHASEAGESRRSFNDSRVLLRSSRRFVHQSQ